MASAVPLEAQTRRRLATANLLSPASVLGLVLFICVGITAGQFYRSNPARFQGDFQVYATASSLVLHGESSHIFDGAATGDDPQQRWANVGTVYSDAATKLGIKRVQLYVYPPILADLLVPLVILPERAAEVVWILINVFALLLTALLLAKLLEVRISVLAPAVAASYAVGTCILWGQVTILFLLLWTASIFAYAQGRVPVSAVAMALATSIKLTPLIVIAPFFIWCDWKWLRSYALSFAALFAAMCAVNGPSAVTIYLKDVIPAMSRGVVNTENKSIGSSVQLLYASLHGSSVTIGKTVTSPSPHAVLILGNVLALALVIAVLAAIARAGRHLNTSGRLLALSMLALVSACAAPVSWRHAYVVALLPLVMLWTRALRERTALRDLALLGLCTLELGSFVFDTLTGHLVHGVLLACESFLAPTCALVLAFYFLRLQPLRTFSLASGAK